MNRKQENNYSTSFGIHGSEKLKCRGGPRHWYTARTVYGDATRRLQI